MKVYISPCCRKRAWLADIQCGNQRFTCSRCGRKITHGVKTKEIQEKYKGKPAGRITIPSYRWGATRLG